MIHIPEVTLTEFEQAHPDAYIAVIPGAKNLYDELVGITESANSEVSLPCTLAFDGVVYELELHRATGELNFFACGNFTIPFPTIQGDEEYLGKEYPFLFMAGDADTGVFISPPAPGETHTLEVRSIMGITSEQYKTAIFEQCRRTFRLPDESIRVAFYTMMYQVLEHDGVFINARGYKGIREAIEKHLNYFSDNNFLTATEIVSDSNFSAKYAEFWTEPLASIGIPESSAWTNGLNSSKFTFTFLDGTTQIYEPCGPSYVAPSEINLRFYSTLDYAQKVMPYWDIQPTDELVPLNELAAGNRATFITNWEAGGLYWHHDAAKQEIEFTGEGKLSMMPAQFTDTANGLRLGTMQTVIYGTGVTEFPKNAFRWAGAGSVTTIVCLHGENAPVYFNGGLTDRTVEDDAETDSTPAITLEIYCDNAAIRAASFHSKTTVNWHPLSEWAG